MYCTLRFPSPLVHVPRTPTMASSKPKRRHVQCCVQSSLREGDEEDADDRSVGAQGRVSIVVERYGNGSSKRYLPDVKSQASSSSETNTLWDFVFPTGFPGSVSDDYLDSMLLQFRTYVTGWICNVLVTSSLLKAVGVGSFSGTTSAAAAAIRWVSKDGIGALGRLLIGGLFGSLFDNDPKQWRMYADFIGSARSFFYLASGYATISDPVLSFHGNSCLVSVKVTKMPMIVLELKHEIYQTRASRRLSSCADMLAPIRISGGCEERRSDQKTSAHGAGIKTSSSTMPFASPKCRFVSKQEKFYPRCMPRLTGPQSRDTPPKRDTGIANEKDWGIDLLNENVNESGSNEDGSTWFRESGHDLGENGYRCRWTRMGGRSNDSSSEWTETWWEKSDWTGYKELGVEKSGKNAEGDSWWETWQEVLHQDEWSNLARIERSAQKQAKSGTENAGWYEKWWEKYDAKGWTEKGAHKYGRLNEQSWWEKWGEHYDGRGSVLKWTDKWAETELGTKWGDKWEEKFFGGIGSRQGETWHVSPNSDRWSRTWGEEHFGNGKVHKYGKSTTGESWDIVVDEETYYEAEPHYGWADVVGDSTQLLSIQPRERPPGVYPNLEFGPSPPPEPDQQQ